MTGLRFRGSPDEQHAAARYVALCERAARSTFDAEAESAATAAARLRRLAVGAVLRAHVPARSHVRLAEPDRFVVLVNDLPWWRAQLGLLCASFAGFEDTGAAWQWDEQDQDFGAFLCGPPNAVLEVQVLYAAASLTLAAKIPRPFVWQKRFDLVTAWLWGAVSAVQEELVALRAKRMHAEKWHKETDPRNKTALVHVPKAPVHDGEFEKDTLTPQQDAVSAQAAQAAPKGCPAVDVMLDEVGQDRERAAAFQAGMMVSDVVRPVIEGKPKGLWLPSTGSFHFMRWR